VYADAIEAKLIEVQGDAVKLDKGSQQGVRSGQIFDLYQEAEVHFLPLTMGSEPVVRSQRRVARVQVFSVERSTSQARVLQRYADEDGSQPPLNTDTRALSNATAVAPNMPPRFTRKPPAAGVAWRETVVLNQFSVANEPDERVIYEWSTSGGILQHTRTLTPVNTWTAPPEAGSYQVNVTATDAHGGQARESVTLGSSGVPRKYVPAEMKVERVFSAASRYEKVQDVTFDGLGRRYLLERGRGGFLSAGSLSLRVEVPDRRPVVLPISDREPSALVVSNPRRDGGRWIPGAVYMLDQDSRTVLRFGFGAPWAQVLEQEPVAFGEHEGGRGNGSFQEPVDLALSPQEDELYVLDAGQRCVQVFDTDGRFLVSFGQPGKGEGRLQRPTALAVGPDGRVYVLDNGRKRVLVYRDWRPVGEFEVGPTEEDLVSLAVDPFDGVVYVLDRQYGRVKRFREGKLHPPHYVPEVSERRLHELSSVARLRMSPTREVWILDREGESVVRVDAQDMSFLGRTGGIELAGTLRIAGTPEGGVVALGDEGKLTCFDRRGWVTSQFGGDGSIRQPLDLAVTRSGNIHVLDARQSVVFAFSRAGKPLGTLGEAGQRPRQLTGVRDLTSVDDRSSLAVLQQRAKDNFNLLDPTSGESINRYGGDYTGNATPRFGCVTGAGGRDPTYWTVADDEESVWRGPQSAHPVKLERDFSEISDLECSVAGLVFVCDYDAEEVYVLSPSGKVVLELPRSIVGPPWDLGVDDYGRLFVYDYGRQRILALTE
jgi:hypothetical protein